MKKVLGALRFTLNENVRIENGTKNDGRNNDSALNRLAVCWHWLA